MKTVMMEKKKLLASGNKDNIRTKETQKDTRQRIIKVDTKVNATKGNNSKEKLRLASGSGSKPKLASGIKSTPKLASNSESKLKLASGSKAKWKRDRGQGGPRARVRVGGVCGARLGRQRARGVGLRV